MPHRQLSAVQQQLAENATRYRECLKWVLKHRIATYTTDAYQPNAEIQFVVGSAGFSLRHILAPAHIP